MNRKFGRLVVLDARDRDHLIETKELSGKKNWREGIWAGDQGETPQCVGFAWSHWLSGYPLKQFLRPQGIYQLAQYLDKWAGQNYDGTSVRGGAKALAALGLIKEYLWGWNLESLVSAVLTTGPVVAGTGFYAGMMRPGRGNVIRATGELAGGHAYLISGVDTEKGRFRMKNSWGLEWGDKGRAYIPFEDMERLIKEDGEICLAIEQPADSFTNA